MCKNKTKPNRILHITGKMNRAGVETMLMNLYRVLDRDKFQFDFLYFTDEKCDYDDEILSLGGKIYRLPDTKYKNIFSRTLAIYLFLKKNNHFFAVHSHTMFSSGFHILAAYLAGIKRRIVHSHNTSDFNSRTFIGRIYMKFSKFLLNKFGNIYFACGKEAAEYLFYKNKNVIQIPNAIDVNYFNSFKGNKYLNEKFNCKDNCLKIIQIGRLTEVKNHKFSILLAEYLRKNNINFKMFFVGEGGLKEKILSEISQRKLEDQIIILGNRNDVPKLLGSADLMIMPSLFEGFPVVLVEAQASGIPSIVSDKVSYEVDLGVGLVYFLPINNTKKWVELIKKIKMAKSVSDEERIKILSQKNFDVFQNVKNLEKVYLSNV